MRKEEIKKFIDGEDSIFSDVYNEYERKIYYFVFGMLRDELESEEVVQSTFVKVFEKRKSLNNVDSFNSWVYKIAYNNSLDSIHNRKKIVKSEIELDEYPNKKVVTEEQITNKLLLEEIQRQIDKLPSDMKEVCVLKYVGECSLDEISMILNIPRGTVKSRLHRARLKLKKSLVHKGVTPSVYLSITISPLTYQLFSQLVQSQSNNPEFKFTIFSGLFSSKKISTILKNRNIVLLQVGVATAITASVMLTYSTYSSNKLAEDDTEVLIQSIEYDQTPTNENIRIDLIFNQKPKQNEITVMNENNQISTEIINEHTIVFVVDQNGVYEIHYKNENYQIEISNIDKEVPSLLGIKEVGESTVLEVHDEGSGIDFEKSYIMNGSEKVNLNKSDDVVYIDERLEEQAHLYLYDFADNYQVYKINLED